MASEDQLILRVPARIEGIVRRFSRGEADTDVSLEPLDAAGNFILTVAGEAFAAKLVSLPTLLESHKTGDHKAYYKSSDITRMLYVYERPPGALVDPRLDKLEDLLPMVADPTPGAGGAPMCDSGITPPTQHIVRRRFKRAQRYIAKYPREEVAEAERVLLDLMVRDSYEHIVEELVDAEPFMGPWFANEGDNVTIVYEDGVVTDMYQLQAGVKPVRAPGAPRSTNSKPTEPVVVPPNADATFGVAKGPKGGAVAAPPLAAAAPVRPSLVYAEAAAAPASAAAAFAGRAQSSGGTGGGGGEGGGGAEAAALMQGLTDADLAALYAGEGDVDDSILHATGARDGGEMNESNLGGGRGEFDDLSGVMDGLPMDVFGDMLGLGSGGGGGGDGGGGDYEMAGTAGPAVEEAAGSSSARPSAQPSPQTETPSTTSATAVLLPDSSSSSSSSEADAGGGSHAARPGGGLTAAAASVDAAAPPAGGDSVVADSPLAALIRAELAASAARLSALQASISAKRAQAEKATIRALRERWEKDGRDLEGRLAAERAVHDGAQARLSAALTNSS